MSSVLPESSRRDYRDDRAKDNQSRGGSIVLRTVAVDYARQAAGRSHRRDEVVVSSGGPAGNARLTAWTGLLLLVLFGAELVTVEGLASDGALHPLQQAFHEHHGLQCGFCTPGMLLTALDFLRTNPEPTEAQIREGLSAVLCRCTGYQGIVKAVAAAAVTLRQSR